MENENITYEKAYAFAIRIINCVKWIRENKKEFVLTKQLLRAGTSIGANVSEANGGISKADFSAKISIAYKECLDTKYLETEDYKNIFADADELGKILFSIIRTSRIQR
ncbi:MAG: four helix bundle protein [Waddliaceae bacterium]|nr:four helix bundle protein [Waddliaceae bacterium]MBT3578712.1 four helix bundle protein [Waddliaceae bacterium]MBT4444386.1 four helix bundle protein [Waddliaceae bacterium]MBT6928301.1 four helix bundle protein [Waddliaceae bacterium]MBT7264987.1 four helix bundle protein [Waddliaceae bacterium]